MSGPQFVRFQTFSRKSNPAGQSVEQVLAEAARAPEFSLHVKCPKNPSIVFGASPEAVRQRHDEMLSSGSVEVRLKDGRNARRAVRQDRHTMLTGTSPSGSRQKRKPRHGTGSSTGRAQG